MNLASSHQRHKTEVLQLQDRVKGHELEIGEQRSAINQLERDLAAQTNRLARSQAELHHAQEDANTKAEEVSLTGGAGGRAGGRAGGPWGSSGCFTKTRNVQKSVLNKKIIVHEQWYEFKRMDLATEETPV